jgi:hypothetical protein
MTVWSDQIAALLPYRGAEKRTYDHSSAQNYTIITVRTRTTGNRLRTKSTLSSYAIASLSQRIRPLSSQIRPQRGNWAAKYDHTSANHQKRLRRQIGSLYDQKKVGNTYGIIRRVRGRLDGVRSWLCRERPPPPSSRTDPLLQTLEHLQTLFPNNSCALTAYQRHFQQAFLG